MTHASPNCCILRLPANFSAELSVILPVRCMRAASDQTGLNVVAIGGGTGLSAILRGFKNYVARPGFEPSPGDHEAFIKHLQAIVTVTDDGGSSGRLRKELN